MAPHRPKIRALGVGMKKLWAGWLLLGALVSAHGAVAADLSLEPLYKSPPAQVTQAYNWTGFYFGANGGGGWGHSFWSANTTGLGLGGGQVGGTLGYNKQLGNVVFGVEGDIDWSSFNGTRTTAGCPGGCGTSDSWLSTVRGRVGYSVDRFMPYLTGGLAAGDIRAAAPGFVGGSSANAGWTLGAGLEVALPGNWSAKAEYLRVDLGGFNCTGCSAAPTDNVSLQENVFRAGVNYRFGWGK
jgi:outer membrane immunogenic protein